MFKMRALCHEDTEKLLELETVISKVEEAYVMKYTGDGVLWPMIFHEFEPGAKDMDIKSGYLKGPQAYGLKLVSWFGPNTQKKLPQLIGTVMVFDAETGAPKALLSGEHITMMRTGAAGGIGAKYLARQDSKSILMVGTGHMATLQIASTLMVMPNIEVVHIWNPLSRSHAEEFKNNIKGNLEKYVLNLIDDQDKWSEIKNKFDVRFEIVDDIEKASQHADIIITATPSKKAMIKKEWVKPGTHFSCIGSDMSGKQEIDETLFSVARVFTDDVNQCISVGEAEKAIKSGYISKASIISEIGAVIKGDVSGRISHEDITIFDSTGIALQDLIVADYAVKEADKKNIGTIFNL